MAYGSGSAMGASNACTATISERIAFASRAANSSALLPESEPSTPTTIRFKLRVVAMSALLRMESLTPSTALGRRGHREQTAQHATFEQAIEDRAQQWLIEWADIDHQHEHREDRKRHQKLVPCLQRFPPKDKPGHALRRRGTGVAHCSGIIFATSHGPTDRGGCLRRRGGAVHRRLRSPDWTR